MPPWTSRYGSSHRHHDKILEKIFGHPATLNIKIFEVTHLVESLGGKVEKVKHGNIRFELNGCHANFPGPIDRGTLHSKDELVKIRHFLERAGAAPAGTAIPGTAIGGNVWLEKSHHGPGVDDAARVGVWQPFGTKD